MENYGAFYKCLTGDHKCQKVEEYSIKVSLCGEVRLDTEESELSDSSNKLMVPSEALDEHVDESTPPHSDKKHTQSDKSPKNRSI